MRRSVLVLILVLGCRKAQIEVRPDDKRSGPPRVTCTLTESTAITIPARCDLTIDKTVKVPAGSSLDIGAGAKLTFAKGAGLVISGGTLRAKGTAEEPIVLTSATRQPGDWTGVVFAPRPMNLSPRFAKTDAGLPPGTASSLEHIVVEFGGARAEAVPGYHRGTAGIYVDPFVDDNVSLAHIKLRSNAGFALFIDSVLSVTKVEAIDYDTGTVRLPTRLLPALAGNTTGTVTLSGTVDESVVLTKRSYILETYVGVSATKATATMEIESGSTVKFETGAKLVVQGKGSVAKLVAHGVVFTTNQEKPSTSDWLGISFNGETAADVDGCTFEFAGGTRSGVVSLPSDESKLRFVNNTFRNNNRAAFETFATCKPWEDPALKNTSVGQPLCEESPLLKSLSGAKILALLGSPSSTKGKSLADSLADAELSPLGFGTGSMSGLGTGPGAGGIGGIGALPPPSSKVVESSITASGALPVDVVRKGVRGRIGSLRACHSNGSGTITVSFSIDDKGSVTSAKVTGGSLTDASTRSCVTGVFQGMSFPTPESGGTTTATATHDYS